MKSIFVQRLIALGFLVVVVSTVMIFWHLRDAPGLGTEQTFKVASSDSIYDIASKLAKEKIVKNRFSFYLAHVVYGRGVAIAAGSYKLSSAMNAKEVIHTLEEKPWAKDITIPPGASKDDIGRIVASALGWSIIDEQFFAHTFSGMQWQRYHDIIQEVFTKDYSWNKKKTQTFLTLSSLYEDKAHDFFQKVYVPDTYEIPVSASRAQVAGILIDRFAEEQKANETSAVVALLEPAAMDNVAGIIEDEMELLPDIVSIPPQDVTLKTEGGKTLLAFTTSYWNKGRGPLEFVADPATKGLPDDVDRKVFQRIYRLDGDYRERLAGTFMWHQAHLHYHFTDFALYTLEPVDIGNATFVQGLQQKSTFCIRDSEPTDLSHPGADRGASYKVCGKERQGISAGWADSYYYTYKDQVFDVTNAPVGTYRLRIVINPEDRFDEITKDNNISEVLVSLDVAHNSLKVLEEKSYGN